jgi:4-amino-4-deoxy-L-arabinose transferase-like glycosyltransferase
MDPLKGTRERSRTAGFLALAFTISLIHLPMLGVLPVSGDEAYYWQCARHPDWSYFDQPALMIALIGGSTRLFGISEWATRLPALLVGLAILLALLGIGRRLFKDTRGPCWAMMGLLATPLFSLGSMYGSTDILLCLFVLVVPALVAVAILEDRPRLWIAAGFLGGLGGLAKLTAVLYLPPLLPLALLHPAGRRHLRGWEPYAGALLGVLAVSPNLIWGALHHMDNITFQLVDRHVRSPFTLRWLGEFLVPQFFLVSPLLFPLLLTGLTVETRRAWRERDLATLSLALPADFFFVFFTLVALRTTSAPHWAAPAVVGGALVTARWVVRRWEEWRPAARRLTVASLLLGLGLSISLHLILLGPEKIPRGWSYNHRVTSDALINVRGWSELAEHLRSLEGDSFDPSRDPIVCDSYTTASLIAFYSQGRYDPMLLASAWGGHGLAYLYWQDPSRWVGRPALYVGDWGNERTRAAFEKAFGEIRDLESFTAGGDSAGGSRSSQTWRILRGERLTSDPSAWVPFRPEGRRAAPHVRQAGNLGG